MEGGTGECVRGCVRSARLDACMHASVRVCVPGGAPPIHRLPLGHQRACVHVLTPQRTGSQPPSQWTSPPCRAVPTLTHAGAAAAVGAGTAGSRPGSRPRAPASCCATCRTGAGGAGMGMHACMHEGEHAATNLTHAWMAALAHPTCCWEETGARAHAGTRPPPPRAQLRRPALPGRQVRDREGCLHAKGGARLLSAALPHRPGPR